MTIFDQGPNFAEDPRGMTYQRTPEGVRVTKFNGSGGLLFSHEYSQDHWDQIVSRMTLEYVDLPPVKEPDPESPPARAARAPAARKVEELPQRAGRATTPEKVELD